MELAGETTTYCLHRMSACTCASPSIPTMLHDKQCSLRCRNWGVKLLLLQDLSLALCPMKQGSCLRLRVQSTHPRRTWLCQGRAGLICTPNVWGKSEGWKPCKSLGGVCKCSSGISLTKGTYFKLAPRSDGLQRGQGTLGTPPWGSPFLALS